MEQERRERREGFEVREAGRKGGATAAAMGAGVPMTETRTAVAFWSPDTIRWGPVWSGTLATLAIDLVLVSIGIGSAFAGYSVTDPNYAVNVATFLSIWSASSLIVAVFFGAWIAGRTGALQGMRLGWFQGTVVWALALIASSIFSSFITTGALGGVANLVPGAAAITQIQPGAVDVQGTALAQNAALTISYAAWIFLIASVLQWASAAIGGWMGAKDRVKMEANEIV